MKNTKSVRDITANLRHIANLFESAGFTEFAVPVTVSVGISPALFASEPALGVVEQMAAVTGVEPAWDTSASTGPYGWYQTVLDPADTPWSVRSSSHGKRPDPAEALKAENERLRTKLAEIEQIAATERPASDAATCVCCNPGDCGDRRGHVRNDRNGAYQCNCGRDWPCEKATTS